MIKTSTVLKRMVSVSWKPIVFGVVSAVVISILSIIAEQYVGFDYDNTYWGLYAVLLSVLFIKSGYEITRNSIKYEQEMILKDLGKK
tara:strand:+ start:1780 stop:2040 length:261 start_codon:yes stop_codon:yes gene_type:complete